MNLFKHLWVRVLRRARDEYKDTQSDIVCASPVRRALIFAVLIYFLCAIGVGVYWSFFPSTPNINTLVQRQLALLKVPASYANLAQGNLPKGVATTSALITVSETLLDKSGGYIANDIAPPGVWLDDMPHWELGVVHQIRDTTQILRASLSQSNLKHDLDDDLQKAEVRFNFSHLSWGFPSTESQYRTGVEHLQKYNLRLLKRDNNSAQFYADSQHLNDYLAGVEQRLKNLSQRLTASVGPSINTDSAAMSVKQKNSQKIATGLYTKTSWWQVDDVFYEARGSAWALILILQGVDQDFAEVLKAKNAQASFDQIIRELEPSQQTVYSPMILNGKGFGFVANHSLSMASYLSRAQAAIADCRRQLLVSSP
jgi:hypothetical protein